MRKSTRMLLGISIALITAASLHLTVGDRFHRRMRGHYGGYGCGHDWNDRHRNHTKQQAEPLDGSAENLNNN